MYGRCLEIRWVFANLAGSSIGFGVFAVLAHGLVGPHDEVHPTLAQVGAHTLGLLPAGAIIALAQQFALGPLGRFARRKGPWGPGRPTCRAQSTAIGRDAQATTRRPEPRSPSPSRAFALPRARQPRPARREQAEHTRSMRASTD